MQHGTGEPEDEEGVGAEGEELEGGVVAFENVKVEVNVSELEASTQHTGQCAAGNQT